MTLIRLMTLVCGCFLSRGQLAFTSTPLSPRTPRRDYSPIKLLAGHSGGRGSTFSPTGSTPTGGMRSPRSSPRRRSSRALRRSTTRRRSTREARRAKVCSQKGLFGDALPSGFIQKSSRIEPVERWVPERGNSLVTRPPLHGVLPPEASGQRGENELELTPVGPTYCAPYSRNIPLTASSRGKVSRPRSTAARGASGLASRCRPGPGSCLPR
jgi:hypothetical protein